MKEDNDNRNNNVESNDEPVRLKRNLTVIHGCAVICGSVVGAGIFISPAGVALKAQSGGLTVAVWVFAGIVSLLGALVYVELGVTYPKSGGCYEYLNQMYGSYIAFLYSWTMITFAFPGGMAIKILMLSDYLIEPFYDKPPAAATALIGLCIASLLIFLNTVTVKWSARGQTLLSILSVVALMVVIGIGFAFASTGRTKGWNIGFEGSSLWVGDWCVAFFSASFAFSGYNALNFLMEEMIQPKKNLPRALTVSIILITICYVLTNISYLAVLGMDTITSSRVVVLDFALRTFPFLAVIFSLLISFINMGSFNVGVLFVSRIMYVGGRDNVFPRIFGLISIRYNTPMVAVSSLWLMIIVYCSFDLFFILNNIMLVYWLFEFLVAAGLLYQRYKHPDLERPLKFPIVLPACFAVAVFTLVLFSTIFEPKATSFGVVIVILTGTPYYLLFVKQIVKFPKMNKLADKVLVIVQKISYSVSEEDENQNVQQ